MDATLLDYDLPEELIAQSPLAERDQSRLMKIDRHTGRISHHVFSELGDLIPPSLFVLNNSRVIPARLFATKETGGKIEVLLIAPRSETRMSDGSEEQVWLAYARGKKSLRVGMNLRVSESLRMQVIELGADADVLFRLIGGPSVYEAIDAAGSLPLPPYIRREPDVTDRERYQTVFSKEKGSIAAPTAGLHFTQKGIEDLRQKGHRFSEVTLHVGPGTFAPLRADNLDEHIMHFESYEVRADVVHEVQEAKSSARKVIAVGTTATRTLESVARKHGALIEERGETDLFLKPNGGEPGNQFLVLDGLITNFHLPRSTLLALVMAFAGIDLVKEAYAEAIREKYRFFSYGDAMLLI